MLKIKDINDCGKDIFEMVNKIDKYFYEIYIGKFPLYLEINCNTRQELVAIYTINCLYVNEGSDVIMKYRVYDIVINNDLKDYEFKIVYPVEEVSNE